MTFIVPCGTPLSGEGLPASQHGQAWTGRTSETLHQKSMTTRTNRPCPLPCAHSNPEGDAQCVEDQSHPDSQS